MENIIISFEGNVEQLKPAIDVLQQLGKIDEATAKQYRETNLLLNERVKSLASNKNALSEFSKGMNNAGKAVAGAFGTKIFEQFEQAGKDALSGIIEKIEALEKQQRLLQNTSGRALNPEDQKAYQQALQATIEELKELYAELDQIQSKQILDGTDIDAFGNAIERPIGLIDQLKQKLQGLQTSLATAQSTNEVARLNSEIEQTNTELTKLQNAGRTGFDQLGSKIKSAEPPAISFRTRLREMREEIARLEETGTEFSDKFGRSLQQLQEEAGNLEDAFGDAQNRIKVLASDTKFFDAAIEGATALTAGFGLAQGAEALFGDENEELAKAMQKLMAVMTILNSLQQIQTIAQKQSTLSILTNRAARVTQTAVTTTQTAAETANVAATEASSVANEANAIAVGATTTGMEANVVATEAHVVAVKADVVATETATTATKGFWATLLATPVGWVIAAVGAIVAVISSLKSETEKATDAQKNLNTELGTLKQINEERLRGIQLYSDKQQAQLEQQKASEADLRKLQMQGLQGQLQILNSYVNQYDAQAEAAARGLEDMAKGKRKYDKDLADSFQATLDTFNSVRAKADDLQNQYDIAQLNDIKATNAEKLKENTAYYEARLAQTKSGTIAEANARINLIKAKAEEEINSAYHTQNEIAAIRAQENKDIASEEQKIRLIRLNTQKQTAEDRLTVAKEGSKEELQARIDLLDVERKTEIENANGNAAAIKNINDNFRKQELQLWKQYNYQVAQDALNAQIQTTTDQITRLQLNNVSALSDEMIEAKKKLIEEQAALEVLSINNSEKNEELRKAKIKAVYDKELLDKQALEKAKLKAEIDNQSDNANATYAKQNAALNALAQNFIQFGAARKKLDNDIYNNSAENIAKQRQLNEASFAGGLISLEDYNKRYAELNQQHWDAEMEKEEAAYRRKVAAAEFAASTLTQIEQSFFQGQINRIESEKQANQDLLNQKLISQNEFNKRQENLQKQQSAIRKQQALFEIFIEGAKKIFEIKAQAALLLANPLTAPYAPIALAQIPVVLIQQGIAAALVATQKFKTGKVKIDGPGTETSDSIPAFISKGESVITAKQTKKHRAALEAIHEDRFEQWVNEYVQKNITHFTTNETLLTKNTSVEALKSQLALFKMPQLELAISQFSIPDLGFTIPDFSLTPITDVMMERATNKGADFKFDYDLHAKKIAAEIVKQQGSLDNVKHVDITIDENGWRKAEWQKQQETEFINNYYSSKGTGKK